MLNAVFNVNKYSILMPQQKLSPSAFPCKKQQKELSVAIAICPSHPPHPLTESILEERP